MAGSIIYEMQSKNAYLFDKAKTMSAECPERNWAKHGAIKRNSMTTQTRNTWQQLDHCDS